MTGVGPQKKTLLKKVNKWTLRRKLIDKSRRSLTLRGSTLNRNIKPKGEKTLRKKEAQKNETQKGHTENA